MAKHHTIVVSVPDGYEGDVENAVKQGLRRWLGTDYRVRTDNVDAVDRDDLGLTVVVREDHASTARRN